MRIGILIRDFETLSNWELRIIQLIIDSPNLDLSLLIRDGRVKNKTLKNRLQRLLTSKNILATLIFTFQIIVEKQKKHSKLTVNKEKIINYLKTIETINVKPQRKGFLDVFNSDDTEKIKNYKLDILLRHEFNIIRGGVLEAAKYGVWSFHHADNSINRGGPAGFWEIVLKQSSVGVTLQQLTPELDGGLVIDKAFFNRHWSFVKTNDLILEASVSLLFKNIRRLEKWPYSTTKSMVYYNPLYRTPNLLYTIKYCLNVYISLLDSLLKKINSKLFGTRYQCWTLFIGKGDFMNSTLFRLKPLKLPKHEFWADPFLFKYQNEYYVFFENYSYKSGKAKISCGKFNFNKDELFGVTDVLDLDYHLSYPYIFEENGDIFLMPESLKNKRLEIYKCVSFPITWELYSTAFEGELVADAFFFDDENNQKWLFVNKQVALTTTINDELFIYKVDSLKMDKLMPHEQNPVLIDSRRARNGGAIFKYENDFYRPSQSNIDGIYGRALNINKVLKLTIDEYIEEPIVTIMPNFQKGLISTHHLHQIDGCFVIDAAYKKKCF